MTDFGRRSPLHSTMHEDGEPGEIDCTGLDGRTNYVDRGDPSAFDFRVGDFTTNNNWHDLDLSSIVPSGAKAVHLLCAIKDDMINKSIAFKKKSNSNPYSRLGLVTQVADNTIYGMGFVSCDSDRVIQYYGSNTTFTNIDLLVLGWFI